MGGGSNGRNAGDTGPSGAGTPHPGGRQFKGVVRWDSAKLILKPPNPPCRTPLANRYVISLSGFPPGGRRSDSEGGGPPKLVYCPTNN
jgi:hypothetical protein